MKLRAARKHHHQKQYLQQHQHQYTNHTTALQHQTLKLLEIAYEGPCGLMDKASVSDTGGILVRLVMRVTVGHQKNKIIMG